VSRLDEIYASHPVSERHVLARLARNNVSLDGLTEWSLAIDADTSLTDQNHPGGVHSVLALALAAGVSAGSTVIDVGAGIGGSARVLAQSFGCSVVAIEQDSQRYQQGIRLTALVGLSHRVQFVQHDALSSAPDITDGDVLWGQSAWAHFPNPDRFLSLWLPPLKTSGRIAMEDAFLVREPATHADIQLIRELEECSATRLLSVDRWRKAFDAKQCEVVQVRDRTAHAHRYFKDLLDVSSTWPPGTVTAEEKHGWVVTADAFERELITFCSLVARKT
jgi:protein-L-isoaspartate O-methyltransferase